MLFLEQIFRLHSSIDAEKRQDYNKQNARNVKRRNKSEKEVLRRRKVVDVQNLIFFHFVDHQQTERTLHV